MKAFARCRLQGRQGSDLQKRQSPTWDIRLCGEWIRWFVDYHRGIAQQFLSTQIEQSLWRLRRWEFKAHILCKELQRKKREHRQVLLQGLQCFIYLFIFSVSGLSLIPLPLPSSKNEKMPCGWGWKRGGNSNQVKDLTGTVLGSHWGIGTIPFLPCRENIFQVGKKALPEFMNCPLGQI